MSLRKAGFFFLLLHVLVALSSLVGAWALYHLPQIPDWNYTAITFWLGIANVLTGVLSALLLMASREGWQPTWTLLILCIVIAGGLEVVGTTTGLPFGPYSYTDMLGPKFLGHVPYLIPPSWMMMLYPAMMLTQVLTSREWLRPMVAGLILTIWDCAMDPAMTTGFVYWQWHTEGGFYGMPYLNWLGWWFTGTLVSALFWKISRRWTSQWEPAALVLYLVQGAFMAAMAWLYMRPLAALVWVVAVSGIMYFLVRRRRALILSSQGVLV